MLTKLDKGFGGVKNLELLEVKWQRNGDGVVEERAETADREAVAVVLVSILGFGHSCPKMVIITYSQILYWYHLCLQIATIIFLF